MSDAPNWADKLSALSSAGQLLAVVVSLFFAYRQLISWRQSELSKTRAANATEIILNAQRIVDGVYDARRLTLADALGLATREGREDLLRSRLAQLDQLRFFEEKLIENDMRRRVLDANDTVTVEVEMIVGEYNYSRDILLSWLNVLTQNENSLGVLPRDVQEDGLRSAFFVSDSLAGELRTKLNESLKNIREYLQEQVMMKR